MIQYVALLRGINVGGNALVKMSDLKSYFEDMGMQKVRTYINSGNVLFYSPLTNIYELTNTIESKLATKLAFKPRVVVKSQTELQNIIKRAPKGWGSDSLSKHNCLFIKSPLTAGKALESTLAKEGVDTVTAGPGVLYFSTLISKATQGYLPKLVGTETYKNMTIRNYKTTSKLLALMQQAQG